MKKRRELDALVNGGKQPGSSRAMKNGRHELLRNDSDSSEVEEFSMPQKISIHKRERCQCCSTCLAMCSGFLLVLCMVAVGGLIWMNIQLKNEVYQLRNQITTLEQSTRNIPEQMQSLSEEQDKLIKTAAKLTDSNGQPALKSNVDSLKQQLQVINNTLVTLSQSQASASASGLHDVQEHFSQLSKTVADIGSHVEELRQQQTGVAEKVTQLTTKVDALQVIDGDKSTIMPSTLPAGTKPLDEYVQQEFRRFSNELSSVNDTLNEKVELLATGVFGQTKLVMSMRNETQQFGARLLMLENQLMASVNSSSASEVDDAVRDIVHGEMEKLRAGNIEMSNQNGTVSLVAILRELRKILENKIDTLDARDATLNGSIVAVTNKVNSVATSLSEATTTFTDSIKALQQTTSMYDDRLSSLVRSLEDSLGMTFKPLSSDNHDDNDNRIASPSLFGSLAVATNTTSTTVSADKDNNKLPTETATKTSSPPLSTKPQI